VAERQARSIRHQMGIALFPVANDLESFSFTASPINESLIRELYRGDFLDQTSNLIFIGGTGIGKAHLAITIAAHCVKLGHRARYYLLNRLEGEKEHDKSGALATRLAPSGLRGVR